MVVIVEKAKNERRIKMKQLTCEMCGGTDLIKQDGVFVCQSCGCKYSVEEAKKMIIEGTVDVTGSTIKVDKQSEIDNLILRAKQFHDEGLSKKEDEYYERVLDIDANNVVAKNHFSHRYFGNVKVGKEDFNMVAESIKSGNKIQAIKLIRELSGLGLKEAKYLTENFENLVFTEPQNL